MEQKKPATEKTRKCNRKQTEDETETSNRRRKNKGKQKNKTENKNKRKRNNDHLKRPRQESTSSSDSNLLSRPGLVAIMRHTKDASSEVSRVAIASGPSWTTTKNTRAHRTKATNANGSCTSESAYNNSNRYKGHSLRMQIKMVRGLREATVLVVHSSQRRKKKCSNGVDLNYNGQNSSESFDEKKKKKRGIRLTLSTNMQRAKKISKNKTCRSSHKHYIIHVGGRLEMTEISSKYCTTISISHTNCPHWPTTISAGDRTGAYRQKKKHEMKNQNFATI